MSLQSPPPSGFLAASPEQDDYVLGRGYQASARLNNQHLYCNLQLEFLLHPNIRFEKKEELAVADIGTGTGVWLLDLARTLPASTRLHGFDISSTQFPRREELPVNICFDILNIFEPIPEHLAGTFDVVNIRFFTTIIRNNDVGLTVQNLVKLLKPGGYLQWVENDPKSQLTRSTKALASQIAMTELMETLKGVQASLGNTDWICRLDAIFNEQGLATCSLNRFRTKPELHRFWTEISCLAIDDFSHSFIDQDPKSIGTGRGAELREVVRRAFAESQNGVSLSSELIVAIGRQSLR